MQVLVDALTEIRATDISKSSAYADEAVGRLKRIRSSLAGFAALLLLSPLPAFGDYMELSNESQSPLNNVPSSSSVDYSFRIENNDDPSIPRPPGNTGTVGNGIEILVDGNQVAASSGTFTSSSCSVDGSFPNFWACNDLAVGGGQNVTFTWGSPPDGSSVVTIRGFWQFVPPSTGPDGNADRTITFNTQVGDPPPVVEFNLASVAVSVAEDGETATLTVIRSGTTTGAVSVDYASSNGTAIAGSDYTAVSGTLSFGSGVTTQTVDIAIVNDTLFEADEDFLVTLQNPGGGATLGSNDTSTVTITDNDPAPNVEFNLASVSVTVAEDDGAAVLTVTRGGATENAVSVDYASSNATASAGSDYTGVSGTLAFGSGVTSQTITVPILDDALDEPDEDLLVTLLNPGGGAILGGNDTSTVTITDNDDAPMVEFNLASVDVSIDEGAGVAILTVVRSGATENAVGVDFATDDESGSASSSSDYTTVSGTLSFGSGVTSQTISVPILDDSLDESAEDFFVDLFNPTGGAILGVNNTAAVTIMDNDGAPAIQFSVASVSVTVNEDAGSATLTVLRSGATENVVTVDFASSDSGASAGIDYTAVSGTLTFGSGVTSQPITVPILNDDLDEESEDFQISLQNPSEGATLGGNVVSTVTITDDEGAPEVEFNLAAAGPVTETDGSIALTVIRSGATENVVTVSYASSDGTALAGSDYEAVSGTLTFGAGVTSQSFDVTILDDGVFENSEDFQVNLTNPSVGAILGSNATTTVTIDSEDPQPQVDLTASSTSVPFNETVDLSWTSSNATSCTAAGGSGFSGTVAPSGSLSGVGPLTDSTTFTLTCLNGDTEVTDSTTVAVEFVVVPSLENLTRSEAEELLSGLGLEVSVENVQSEDVPAGQVAGTNPPANSRLAPGDDLVLLISSGPEALSNPVAVALDKTIVVEEDAETGQVSLDASASEAGAGEGVTIVEYEWTNLADDEILASSANAVSQLPLPVGEYAIGLKITNSLGLEDTTEVAVVVSQADEVIEDFELLSDNEQSTAGALVDVCNTLNSTPDAALTDDQLDLQGQCSAIILTDDSGAQTDALGAINGQQLNGQATNVIEIYGVQTKNIAARLDALQRGSRGISVAGLGLNVQGKQIPAEAIEGLLKGLIGGVAGSGDSDFGRLGLFINGNISVGSRDETDNEAGFDFDIGGITFGGDYRFTDNFVAGLAIGYGEGDTEFDNDRGGVDTDGWSAVAFGTYFSDRFYVDGQFSYGWVNHDSTREITYQTGTIGDLQTVERTAVGDTEGNQWSTGLRAGWTMDRGAWSFVPNASAYYARVDIDGFDEDGAGGLNLAYDDQIAKSMTLGLGAQLAYTWTPRWGVVRPQLRVDWINELEKDASVINVRFLADPGNSNPITITTDEPDDRYFHIGLGVSAQMTNGFSAFIDWQTLESYNNLWVHNYSFGVRFERLF